MKLNKKLLTVFAGVFTCTLLLKNNVNTFANNSNTQDTPSVESHTQAEYLDTKHKSADGQFETAMGTFFEIPLYENEEKIKNILFANSSPDSITSGDIWDLRDICLDSPYKYDEVFIRVKDTYCIKYNPFTNEVLYGTIDDNYNFTKLKSYVFY